LDELKADIRKNLEERAEKSDKAAFEDATVRAVCDNAEVEIPEVMVDNEVETMAQDQAMRMSQQGIELDMYLNYIGQSMDEFRESLKPMARVRVKSALVIEAITEKINPEVTDEDYEKEIESMAEAYRMSAEDVKNAIGEDSEFLKDSIRGRKTVEYLTSKAVKTEPKPAEEEETPAAEETAEETPAEESSEE